MLITKTKKSPYYQLVYEVDGKKTSVSTKTTNYKEAQLFLLNFLKEKETDLRSVSNQVTILQFKNEYVEYLKTSKSKNYIRSVELSFKTLILYTGDILLNRIDIRTLDKFITSLFSKIPRACVVYYRTLKAAFSKAVQWNYIPENLFKKIKSPKVSKMFPAFISETELNLILDKTREDFLRDLFITGFYTGMRLGELVNMKCSWIDLIDNQITVQCSDSFTTKNKKGRVIPFNSNVKNIFVNRLPKVQSIKNDDIVFSRIHGVRLNENYVSKKFKEYVLLAGLDDKIHFHTLRHSFASLLVQRCNAVRLREFKEEKSC
jgi:integrase